MRHAEYKNYLIHYIKTSNGVSTNIYKDNKMVAHYWSENYKKAEQKAHIWIDYNSGKISYDQYEKSISKFLK
jgi:hypothetical protein